MLDLICVSSVLIVCSSLHFTWRKEGRKKKTFSAPQSTRGARLTPLPTSLSRVKNQPETPRQEHTPCTLGVNVR